MSGVLDWYFRATNALAATCFVAVAVLVLYQLGGQVFPYVPRSADEFAGYCMGASAFLGLADALRSGDHIRVTLVTERFPPRGRRFLDWVALATGLGLAVWIAWYTARLAIVSWQLDDVSSGLIALPMWVPQGGMAWGAIAFVVAMLELAMKMRGGAPLPGGGDMQEFNADR